MKLRGVRGRKVRGRERSEVGEKEERQSEVRERE